MPKHPTYLEDESSITGEKKSEVLKVDNLDKINKALDTGLAIVDKIIGLKKYREEQGGGTMPPAQQSQIKAEKIVSKQKLIIDDELAINKLIEYSENIDEEVRKKPLGEVLKELTKNKEFIKPQINTFLRGCVRLE